MVAAGSARCKLVVGVDNKKGDEHGIEEHSPCILFGGAFTAAHVPDLT
jgi:hypothetical protein